jgi:hypothetical protein
MSGPITPDEAAALKVNATPEGVYEAFNELIAKHYVKGQSVIKQKEIVKLILKKLGKSFTEQQIYDNRWLDIEPEYRAKGWKVKFDSPGWDESYEPFFEFSKA